MSDDNHSDYGQHKAYLQRGIATCKHYERNGLPEHEKAAIRGERRSLEHLLDQLKAEQRDQAYA